MGAAAVVPAILCIADGWGEGPPGPGNAIRLARTPQLTALRAGAVATRLTAHGTAVGLPDGQQGNSEVGHLTIGAGRVVQQDLTRIDAAIADQSFFANPALVGAITAARDHGRRVHVLGLLSAGGVHSHQDHILAIFELCRRLGMPQAYLHAFLDGRDTPPTSGAGFLEAAAARLSREGIGRVASCSGRYFAMDRDHRWDRIHAAYRAIATGTAQVVADPVAYVRDQYAAGVTDEFVTPVAVAPAGADPVWIAAGDTVIHANFRPDRARQLTHALVDPHFDAFPRGDRPGSLQLVTLTRYEAGLPVAVAFSKPDVLGTLGDAVAAAGRTQFHVAETEKYAHVTYFINGGREAPLRGEERHLVPSPRVATYDLAPEMSAAGVAQAVLGRIRAGSDALIVVNFANADMLGHTGDLAATIAGVEEVDRHLGAIATSALAQGWLVCFTADHGNAEAMLDPATGGPRTAHTTNPVPLILAGPAARIGRALGDGGALRDVAPTVLAAMGIAVPAAMTGSDLRR
ncbi:MAG TPA: 2,3-bisphosphoglycerate-independent phosphoglycerate mutase [Verrucomicrobiae bacterium]|nr:2,3-bisphosphoglycerate-independent phosphoglycerate mutase [Verrucomicrobiae bacterium]